MAHYKVIVKIDKPANKNDKPLYKFDKNKMILNSK